MRGNTPRLLAPAAPSSLWREVGRCRCRADTQQCRQGGLAKLALHWLLNTPSSTLTTIDSQVQAVPVVHTVN